MPRKTFFDTLRDSIHQIVSGEENAGPSAGEKQRQSAAKDEMESAVIVLASEIMRLDGNDSTDAKKILTTFLERNFGRLNLSKRNKQMKDHLFTGPRPFTKMACEQLKTMATHGSRQELIRLLYEVASADGPVNNKEQNTIHKIAGYLDLTDKELRTIRDRFARLHDPFAILEITETSSVVKVKAAYRKMALKYHPDKRSDDVSEDEANRRFREMKKAYEMIMRKLS